MCGRSQTLSQSQGPQPCAGLFNILWEIELPCLCEPGPLSQVPVAALGLRELVWVEALGQTTMREPWAPSCSSPLGL